MIRWRIQQAWLHIQIDIVCWKWAWAQVVEANFKR